jgi:8-oxo-dGTP pyrophosphatase MutT (NUDIX family)
VLLCHNYGGDWELPGGRPEPDESHEECLVREVWEETGLAVRIDRPLGTVPFEVAPERWVDLIGYSCTTESTDPAASLVVSDEHVKLAFLDPATPAGDALSVVYRRPPRGRHGERAAQSETVPPSTVRVCPPTHTAPSPSRSTYTRPDRPRAVPCRAT